jgi:PAS domain S-box-containing protein
MADSQRREVETKNKVITSIFRISNLLTQQIDLDEILYSILITAKKDLGFSAACLFLLNEEKSLLECRMITGFGDKGEYWAYNKPFRMDNHDCMETKVVKSGRVMYFEDTLNDPGLTEIDRTITQRLNRGRVVYAPLTVKGKIIGCMGVNRPMADLTISEEEIEAFTIFANQASIIIENSQFSKQLMSERNLNESILESSPNGILTIDRDGKIISLNRAGEDILSARQGELLAMNMSDAVEQNQTLSVLRDVLLCPSIRSSREFDFRREDGSRCCLEVIPSPFKDIDGNETGTLFLFRDLTEKKIIGEQVQRMAKLASVGQLAAGVSHEIRNPLMGIGATLELTLENIDIDHPQREMLMRSMEEIERIDDIISDLLDLARSREMNFESWNINDIIKEACQFLSCICQRENIGLILNLDDSLSSIHMDKDKVRQTIINIALNAIQSMEDTGVLKISTSVPNCEYYTLSNGGIQITVEDNGKGIAPDVKDKVFDPFFTTRPDGTGLGLYNCHRVVEAHHGNVFIEDGTPGGTKVTVLLPCTME